MRTAFFFSLFPFFVDMNFTCLIVFSACLYTADVEIALHAYACDCVTHHLFHPNGSDCIGNKADEEMMHQVAADDSLQSK